MKLSFGMIFSIILIAVFISIAFFAIQKFLSIQNVVKLSQFKDKLQADVDKMWKSSQGSQQVEYFISSSVEKVCFVDYSSSAEGKNSRLYNLLKKVYYGSENVIFYPIGSAEGLDAIIIEHIDLSKIVESENPFCIEKVGGKVQMVIKKDYGESLVQIKH